VRHLGAVMPRRRPTGPPDPTPSAPQQPCVLCGRPLGARVEQHHLVPKSRGGTETAPIHPICHRAIHAAIPNAALERDYADPERLRDHPEIARFIGWVRGKPPDFHAATRRRSHDEERWRQSRKHH